MHLRPRRAALLAAAAVASVACCGERYDRRAISPDKRYEAAVVERNCGATTDFVSFVRIEDRRALLVRNQDVMRIDGSVWLTLVWSAPRHLIIEYPPGRAPDASRTYGPPARWEDVTITIREGAR
jgi:hypothetical protein